MFFSKELFPKRCSAADDVLSSISGELTCYDARAVPNSDNRADISRFPNPNGVRRETEKLRICVRMPVLTWQTGISGSRR